MRHRASWLAPGSAPGPAAWRRLPQLVRFLILHGLVGFGVSALFVAALVATDPGGAGTVLVQGAGSPWPVAVLWFFSGLTFGGVQIAAALMLLDEEAARPPRRGTPVPVPVRARSRRG